VKRILDCRTVPILVAPSLSRQDPTHSDSAANLRLQITSTAALSKWCLAIKVKARIQLSTVRRSIFPCLGKAEGIGLLHMMAICLSTASNRWHGLASRMADLDVSTSEFEWPSRIPSFVGSEAGGTRRHLISVAKFSTYLAKCALLPKYS
jgi:hypothetical protein